MKKIILALDVCDFNKAEKLVKETASYVDVYKLGPILLLRCGEEIVKMIKDNGKEIFLDLKFHDIPATVKRAIESARELGVFSLTVHSVGGEDMLRAAASVKNRPKIWAVTVLTSQVANRKEVIKRAKLAKVCGVDGVISSPLEIALIKKECGREFDVITPGIRLEKVDDDQKRVATPEVAIKEGADFIVVGRPILDTVDPTETVRIIYNRMIG
ncbi:MAG: orotidine-5'-phosphate decarboxylase [Endomicrobium sp.]|jgi:orotidine-5'-phosphate decarboxylase|nr:orotidine-5'-phosphate decarboxylase [Endomicrobium sp.]